MKRLRTAIPRRYSNIKDGGDINVKDRNEQTFLMHAAVEGCTSIVKLLLDVKAGAGPKDKDDMTTVWYKIDF